MTITQLYEWAVTNGAEDLPVELCLSGGYSLHKAQVECGYEGDFVELYGK